MRPILSRILRTLLFLFTLILVLYYLSSLFYREFRSGETSSAMLLYVGVPVVLVLGVYAANVYRSSCLEKMNALLPLLAEKRVREYTEAMEKLLKASKGQRLKTLLTMNLASGYMAAEDYEQALALLENLPAAKLRGVEEKLSYIINRCKCCFETGQDEKMMELYSTNLPLFRNYGGNADISCQIKLLDIMAAIIDRDYARSESLLEEAMKTYKDQDIQAYLLRLSGRVGSSLNCRS